MKPNAAEKGTNAANEGIRALRENRRDRAAMHFNAALDHFEDMEDPESRRGELGPFALMADQVGFPDIALLAAKEAVELSKQLGDVRHLAEDLVTCGNANLHMGNMDEALSYYRRARDMCVENGDFDNAASASTNMAVVVGNSGSMDEAIHMLYQSLDYLAQKSHPQTEVITRIALTQALEAELRPPEDIFAVARPVAAFAKDLRPDQWDGLRGPLEQTIRRFTQLHPEVDPVSVKTDALPGLF